MMRYLSSIITGLALVCVAGGVLFGMPGEDVQASQLLTNALQRHVKAGLVDYGGIALDKDYLRYLKWLGDADPESFESREAEMPFWINAYNALAIEGVLRNSRLSSPDKGQAGAVVDGQRNRAGRASAFLAIKSVLDVSDFFNKQQHRVASKKYTLDQIEKEIIFPKFTDAKLHFVLVCAAMSCPALTPEAFTAANVKQKMEDITREFINNPDKNRLDREEQVLYLSQIFNWYRDDFGQNEQDVIEFIKPYLNVETRDFLAKNKVKIKHLEYDWRLNAQSRSAGNAQDTKP